MKTFKIPVTWEVYGTVEIQAETAEKALYIAKEIEHQGEGLPLPTESEYVDGSFEINDDIDLVKMINQ